MKQEKHIKESELKDMISETIKNTLKESDHIAYGSVTPSLTGPSATGRETYRGIPGTRFIWYGEWSSPEIEYDGAFYDYNDVEDYLWNDYKEEGGDENNDDAFDAYCREHGEEALMYYCTPKEEDEDEEDDLFESACCKKKVKHIKESELKDMIAETVKNALKENVYPRFNSKSPIEKELSEIESAYESICGKVERGIVKDIDRKALRMIYDGMHMLSANNQAQGKDFSIS